MQLTKPKLRFPEFDNNWEKKNFKELVKLQRGSSPRPIVAYNTTSEDGVNWIKIGDISKDGAFIEKTKEKITKEGAKKSRYVEKGEIILSNSMSFGRPCILKIDGYIHDGWFVIREYDKFFDKEYLCQLLGSEFVQKQYSMLAAGGVVSNISSELVNAVNVNLPSIAEQSKIGNFLHTIDKKINQLTEKKEVLVKYKKGVMQKIFNQEIRFKDENGNDYPKWSEARLSNFKNLIHGDGDWILSNDLSKEGKHKLIQLGNIGYGIYKEKDLKTISAEKFNELKGTPIKKGDLLINRMVDSNLYCCILDKEGDYITSVDVCWIRESNFLNNYFLMSVLLFEKNQNKLLNLSSGSGRVRISKYNLFNEFYFMLPSFEEQTKIASFISAIDDKINQVVLQLEKTNEFKNGLLQQMLL